MAWFLSEMDLPQHPKFKAPHKNTFPANAYPIPLHISSTSSTRPNLDQEAQKSATNDQCQVSTAHEPAQYTWDDGPRDMPGTAAYYKSWTFRKKVNAGENLVPGEEAEEAGTVHKSDEDYRDEAHSIMNEQRSLIMILSRSGARRATTQRKVHARMQRANRRMKLWRKIENVEGLFGWD
ncbi:hypothetical protein N0V94_007497 [Neodidymelliopsis sp. IMI 364377]|nr:hypothetical protein N0V94_007497 [Neodidymelliopsis sp. IMI 364377]